MTDVTEWKAVAFEDWEKYLNAPTDPGFTFQLGDVTVGLVQKAHGRWHGTRFKGHPLEEDDGKTPWMWWFEEEAEARTWVARLQNEDNGWQKVTDYRDTHEFLIEGIVVGSISTFETHPAEGVKARSSRWAQHPKGVGGEAFGTPGEARAWVEQTG